MGQKTKKDLATFSNIPSCQNASGFTKPGGEKIPCKHIF